jgi:hypothetical protein
MNSIAASTQPPSPPLRGPIGAVVLVAAGRPEAPEQPTREFDANKRKQMKVKWLSFAFIIFINFCELGLFKGLRPIQIKKFASASVRV